jgi:hypothetical protein
MTLLEIDNNIRFKSSKRSVIQKKIYSRGMQKLMRAVGDRVR